MHSLYRQALTVMENAFHLLEEQLPPPQIKKLGEGFVFRYKEETVEQVLIQKLARSISGLHAVDVLLVHGFVQEQAVLCRTLDEIHEDITFLAASVTNDTLTKRHKEYLSNFYAEEFSDPNNTLARSAKPNMVPRKEIRAYVNRILSPNQNPSRASDIGHIISSVYSGYVHASSPQIMDMYIGNPPRFHLSGMLNTPRVDDHTDDAWNYYYRGLLALIIVTKAFGDEPLAKTLYEYLDKFEKTSGTNYIKSSKS